MSYNNENCPISAVVSLGSPSAAATLPALYLSKKAVLVSAYLINGAGVAAQAGSYLKVELKDQDDAVIAKVDTQEAEEGALSADVGKALEVLQSQLEAGSSLKAVYSEQEGVAEVTEIECVADASDSLNQTSFLLHDDVGSVAFWFDTDDSGSTIPTDANAADRAVEITTVNTDDDAETVASKVAVAINADSKFSAVVDSEDATKVIVTASTVGEKTDATDGEDDEATGFTFTVLTQGIDSVAQALTDAKLVLNYFYP